MTDKKVIYVLLLLLLLLLFLYFYIIIYFYLSLTCDTQSDQFVFLTLCSSNNVFFRFHKTLYTKTASSECLCSVVAWCVYTDEYLWPPGILGIRYRGTALSRPIRCMFLWSILCWSLWAIKVPNMLAFLCSFWRSATFGLGQVRGHVHGPICYRQLGLLTRWRT